MDWSIQLLVVASTITTIFLASYLSRPRLHKNSPPSLPWLPFIGSLPFLLSNISSLCLCLTEKRKKYGNVFYINCGRRVVLILNGYEAIREALVTKAKDFAGRDKVYIEEHVMNKEFRGIGFRQYGEEFVFIRKASVAILKKFGFGKNSAMETIIQHEIKECVKFIHSKNGEATDFEHIVRLSILNVIYTLVFGNRFEPHDHTGEFVSFALRAYETSFHPTLDIFPIARFFPSISKVLKDMKTFSSEFEKYFLKKCEECASGETKEQNFISEFLKMSGDKFQRDEPYYIIKDFLLGGTDTSAAQLRWAFILLANNQDIQKRLLDHIDSVVPRDRFPCFSDKLPYVEASLLETMRMKTSTPLALPHMTMCDTEVQGFFIAAGTQVQVNIWSAHMDPKVWPEPNVYRPERFLNEDGEIINKDLVMNFSLGKRGCPGEILARQELFLFLATLVQQFHILPPVGQKTISDKGTFSLLYVPDSFKVRLVPRK